MGTRGTYGFRKNNKDLLAYRHHDSDIDGAGRDMIEFIKGAGSIEKIHSIHDRLIAYDETLELREIPEGLLKQNKDVVNGFALKEELYAVFRWNQDLNIYLKYPEVTLFPLHNSFIKNSLYCEYGYVINLDTNELELYEGFQNTPTKDNIYGTEQNKYGYYPCACKGKIPLEDILKADTIYEVIEIMEEKILYGE
ncbi:MAG: hypothetical protein ACRCRT_00350 [Cetobacterium somerae]